MNRHPLPRALFSALVAGAAAVQPAVALPPLKAELVDEATLATMSGKFYGANLLVGLRVDLVSSMSLPDHSRASASGSLSIRRVGSGYDVRVDSRADASGYHTIQLPAYGYRWYRPGSMDGNAARHGIRERE